VYILSNTFNIVLGIFDVAQSAVNASAGLITGNLELGGDVMMDTILAELEGMEVGELIGLFLETAIVRMCLGIMAIIITIVVWGRMIEIYLTVSIAPIPLSTLANREWGQVGNNYLKSLIAIAFQGFLIMVCVAIYAVLVNGLATADNIHTAIWTVAGYTALLCFILLKTGGIARSLFSAH
jgi:hypothetical protein